MSNMQFVDLYLQPNVRLYDSWAVVVLYKFAWLSSVLVAGYLHYIYIIHVYIIELHIGSL